MGSFGQVALAVTLLGCSTDAMKTPSDAMPDVVMEAATDAPADSGTCPSIHCPTGQYCLVIGAMPDASQSGTCQPIPSGCTSMTNICMCPIIVCNGPGLEGCSNDTIYCN